MVATRVLAGIFSIGLIVGSAQAPGQTTYPTKPIRIVTAPAGGGADFIARPIAQGISAPLGQPVIVDNRATLLAAELVSRAPSDGYTLLVAGGTIMLTPLLQKVSYDPVRDFSPISLVTREVNVLAVNPTLPVKTVKDLIALAKAKPAELNHSSGGIGSLGHLGMELFKQIAGVEMVHVPSKGGALAISAVIAGEVQATIADARAIAPHAKSGRLRSLAVTTAEPSVLVPGLPTVAGSGLPGYEMLPTTGIFAPGKTSASIVNRLNQEIVRAVNKPDVKEKLLSSGVETVGSSPEMLAIMRASEIAKWARVIKEAGIRVD